MQVQKKYIVYKITNIINGRIYIGVHQTNDIDDGYMGSGINIKRAIKKYGIDNFVKEYLAIFDNPNDMSEMESQLVNKDFLLTGHTYNIIEGGHGGFSHINHSPELKKLYGSWNDKDKRRKVWESVPLEFRIENAKKMGRVHGGKNKLSEVEVLERLERIKDIDLSKFGWVQKVADRLNITHTQTKRFIDKYYKGSYFRRIK